MSTPIPLIELSALPEGRGRRVCKAALDLAVFRIGDAVYAIDDSCPHAGGSLSNGKLQGTRVTCPVHGLKFDLDIVRQPSVPTLQAKRYPLLVIDGIVLLAPDEHSPNDRSTPVEKEAP
jgi:nitrite reductase/ring-hydroxylating ferredoxin subunit